MIVGNKLWYVLYNSFAEELNFFYKKYEEKSGEIFYKKCMKYEDEFYHLFPFVEKFDKGNKSLDPIHIFASFNYFNISPKKRKNKLKFFYKILDIDETIIDEYDLNVFECFPHPNITHIVANRDISSQKEIWKFFNEVLENKDFSKYIDNLKNNSWYGIKIQSLTIFMFWINSNKYIPLDKNTISLLKNYKIITHTPNNYKNYIQLVEKTKYYNNNICRSIAIYALGEDRNDKLLSKVDEKEVELFLENKILPTKNLDELLKEFQNNVKESIKDSSEERKKRLKIASKKAMKINVTTTYRRRNPDVVAEVLARANGICECCKKEAPFYKKDGTPFLEVHHIKFLSEDGEDSIENAEALCPNCHREKHFGNKYN